MVKHSKYIYPKISVVTPTYNRADFIEETIKSVLDQDFQDFEYLILDDGSTDNTEEIVKPFLKDKRVKYLKHENAGEAETVNWGWQLAKGEYFIQVNSDDPILPGLFSEMVHALDKNKEYVLAYPNYHIINNKNEIINNIITGSWDFIGFLRIFSCECATPGTFIRKSAFYDWNKIKDSTYKYISDIDMYWKMALKGNFLHIPKFLANWRQHDQGVSASRWQSISEIIKWYGNYFSNINIPNYVYNQHVYTYKTLNKYIYKLLKNNKEFNLLKFIRFRKLLSTKYKIISKLKLLENKHNPLVSVIIPVYNGENYVREAIDSVLSQTYKNIEIVVVNDGSTDNTDTILNSYGTKIKYYKKENGGVGSALNLAIKKAKGEYISWLSHDDMYHPEKIREQIEYLFNNSDANRTIIFSDFEINDYIRKNKLFIKSGNESHFNYNNFDATLLMLFTSQLHGCTLLIPRGAFYDVGFFDETKKTTQDYHLWFQLLNNGYKYLYLPKRLVIAKKHELQDTILKKDIHIEELVKLYKWALEYFSDSLYRISPKTMSRINSKLKKYQLPELHHNVYDTNKQYLFKNLQINNTDIVGNKFNGYDLHIQLRQKDIDSKCLVWTKESTDKNTHAIVGQLQNRTWLSDYATEIQKQYSLNGIFNPISYEILYNQLFLDADVVHFHLMHNKIFDLQLLPLFSRLKPIVWTIHDPWLLGGHCIHHFDCQKWQSHCEDCPYPKTNFPLEKDNSALNFALKRDAIMQSNFHAIVASKWMENKLKVSPLFKHIPIHLIPFGIDQKVFRPIPKVEARNKFKIPPDALVISFRCDRSEFKGLNNIEYALNNIQTKKKVYLLVLADKLKENPSQFFIKEFGWIKDDNLLAQIYSASDLFLMPSIVETFGMMAIEAMSCGTLPIIMDGTALPEVINAPMCGVSTPQNKDDFLSAVQYYIDHPEKIVNQANKCYEYARKHYSLDTYIDKIINVYKISIKNHQLTSNDQYLLSQLKKHMIIYPSSQKNIQPNNPLFNLNEKFNLNSFYKVSQYAPLPLRNNVKKMIHKIGINI